MVREFSGPYWGAEYGTHRKQPINLLGLYISIVARSLVAKNPRTMLSTFNRMAKPAVSAMQAAVNRDIEKMKFDKVLKRIVYDGLFNMGIGKVSLASPGDAALKSWGIQSGQPYMDSVDFDDWVHDTHTRNLSDAGYMGHRVRIPRDEVLKFYKRTEDELPAQPDKMYNLEGDERISLLGRGMYGDHDEYEDFIDVWEIYLPRQGVVVTLSDDAILHSENQEAGDYRARALKVQKWIGPYCGPYHFLGFIHVPGNAMPKGPAQDAYDLHDAINNIFRKLIRQAQRSKKVTLYGKDNPEDAQVIKKANDGDLVGVSQPERIKEVIMGGPDQQLFMLGNDLMQRAFMMLGNLATLGGLSPEAQTAHQEQILDKNSGSMLSDMQDAVIAFTSKMIESYCWFVHHHPTHVMKVDHKLAGAPDIAITRHVGPANLPIHPVTGQRWSPDDGVGFSLTRDHSFEDMEVKIDPYSLAHQTPGQRLAGLNEIVQKIFMPMAQQAQQQGLAFNFEAYLKKVAEYMDQPDISDILATQETPLDDAKGQSDNGPQAPGGDQTTTHVRENVPQRTMQGDSLNLRNALAGVNPGGDPRAQSNGVMQ